MSDPAKGWSPERCMALGATLVDVAVHCAPYVRAEGPFWETMDAQDAYTRPTEGTANSTIPQRSAGWSGGQEGEGGAAEGAEGGDMRTVEDLVALKP